MGTVQSSFIVVFFPDLYRVYRMSMNRNCCILMYANLLSPHLQITDRTKVLVLLKVTMIDAFVCRCFCLNDVRRRALCDVNVK